jgi:cyclic pyranopterin phosphate synthase
MAMRPLTASMDSHVVDTLLRPLRDLRISVTDRCNFRCVYCMPREAFGPDHAFLERDELLTFEEIERLARAFAANGVEKLRLTGGEPLVRRNLPALVSALRTIPGIREVALTTNGSLLARHARALADAGLSRVTVSLDALDDGTFQRVSDTRLPVRAILDGIAAAEEAGLGPVKINAVVRRGYNEHAVLDLARRFRHTGVSVRFIEYMDVGHTNGWRMSDVVPAEEIIRLIDAAWPLESVTDERGSEVAERYRYLDGGGEIGVIASVTRPFCGECVRARLSADGKLFTCLFALRGHDLRGLVRGGATDEDLRDAIAAVWRVRDDRYSELRTDATAELPKVEMSYIGG